MRKQKIFLATHEKLSLTNVWTRFLSESLSQVITLQKPYHMLLSKLLFVWKLMAWVFFRGYNLNVELQFLHYFKDL